MTEKEPKGQEKRIDRRQFLKWASIALIVGTAGGAGAFVLGERLEDKIYTDEGNEDFPVAGELLQGGEIVNDQELADMYLEAVEEGRPIEPDPTMIKSTVHNAMRFFGMDEKTSSRRSQNISISNSEDNGCGMSAAACTYNSSLVLGWRSRKKLWPGKKISPKSG